MHILARLGPEEEERKNYICTIEGEESGASLAMCAPLSPLSPSPPLPSPFFPLSPPPFPVSPHCFNEWDSRPWFMDEEKPESIQCFIEEQAYSSSYDLAAYSLTPSFPSVSSRPAIHRKTEQGRHLDDGKGGRLGEEQNHNTARKPGPL